MRLEGNKVILETRECSCTWRDTPGLEAKRVICPVCNGTGNGKRGGRGQCKECNGFKSVYSETENVTCGRCNGTARVPETSCDTMPDAMYLALPFKVYRHKRELTYAESLLAWNCVYSCSDYGRSSKATDESIISDVRSHGHVQLCKVANKELELCDHVGIFVAENGYSVRAVFKSDASDALKTIASERSYNDGMTTAQKIYNDGGNGTLGAIYKK